MRRHRMSRRSSNRVFHKGRKTHKRNLPVSRVVRRGGTRI